MSKGRVLRVTTCAILIGGAIAAEPARGQDDRPARSAYEHGEVLIDENRVSEAVDLWLQAWDESGLRAPLDPRIGLAFIDLVTLHGLTDHYETATAMYLESWSAREPQDWEVLREEWSRVAPLFRAERRDSVGRSLESGNVLGRGDVQRFWIERDPDPSTPVNERLIEHWERVQYARDQFTRGRRPPYGTDDRGAIYVRYGPPQEKWSGSLGASEAELRMWINHPVDRDRIRQFDTNPSYELWVYDKLSSQDFTYFLFGNRDGTGPFELVDGVEDLIPRQAKSAGSRMTTPNGLRASHYLQLFYYSDLAKVGGPYARRYSELQQAWGAAESRSMAIGAPAAAPPESRLEALQTRFEQVDRFAPRGRPERPSISDYDTRSSQVDLIAFCYRVLTPDERTQLKIVALSAPRTDVDQVWRLRSDGLGVDAADIAHSVLVRDENLNGLGTVTEQQTTGTGDLTTFTLFHPGEPLYFTVLAQRSRGGRVDALPAQQHLVAGSRLSGHPDSLEVSDLVLGIEVPPELEDEALPFPLVPTDRIWRGDVLRVYMEVYRLRGAEDGSYPYALDFRLEAWNPTADAPRRERTPVSVSYEIEGREAREAQSFDLGVGHLPPGPYRLTVTVTDRVSGQAVVRSAPVTIRDRE